MSETATRSFLARKANGNPVTVWVVNTLTELPVTNITEGDVGFVLDDCLFYERLVNTSGWTLVFEPGAVEGTIEADDVVGLEAAVEGFLADELAGKADLSHTHAQADITNLVTDLAGKAASVHTHSPADITFAATDKLLGRVSASGGAGEEVTCTDFAQSLLDDADAAAARTTLSAAAATHTHTLADITDDGTIASQNANNVSITGGSITGITDLAVADGGTGASTAAGARTNLEVAQVSVPISFGNGLGSGYAVVDNTNHYLAFCANPGTAVATAANGIGCVAQEKAGTITAVRFGILVGGTNGSGETGSLFIRVNNTTDNTVVNNTLVWNTGITFTEYNVTGLSIALSAGDFWQVKIDPPTFATNPTAVFYFCQVTVTYP